MVRLKGSSPLRSPTKHVNNINFFANLPETGKLIPDADTWVVHSCFTPATNVSVLKVTKSHY